MYCNTSHKRIYIHTYGIGTEKIKINMRMIYMFQVRKNMISGMYIRSVKRLGGSFTDQW